MGWLTHLREHVKKINNCYVLKKEVYFFRDIEQQSFLRKLKGLEKRDGEIIKSTVDGTVLRRQEISGQEQVDYVVHFQHLIQQYGKFHIEEKIETRRGIFFNGELIDDYCYNTEKTPFEEPSSPIGFISSEEKLERVGYSRLEAVRYAERWWNDYNPAYMKFENNCTNFISQCLRAGGAPMVGHPNRGKGWWFQNKNWSFSWSVANAMRWYLGGAKAGLRAQEVANPEDLIKGDIICYDFDGDGVWQHTTIVVAKDENNMPLVNAQTTNSRMRYWAYEDSTAWTPAIAYKFFHIVD